MSRYVMENNQQWTMKLMIFDTSGLSTRHASAVLNKLDCGTGGAIFGGKG
jgi:hypothetical protein